MSRCQEAALLLLVERLAVGAGLDHLAQPDALLVRGEVLDLVADRPAVGVAHPRQRVEERLAGDADPEDRRRDLAHQLGRQVQVLGLERRVALAVATERVERGREVPMGPVGLEQRRGRLDGLHQFLVGRRVDGARRGGRRRAGGERRRRGGRSMGLRHHGGVDAERLGDALVELVLAAQQLIDRPQERARLGSLDDPVVVGGRHRHHLRDAERLESLGRGVGPLGRVGDRAGRNDRSLAAHQARDRGHRAEPARVRQRDVRPDEVVGGQRVLARLADQLLVLGVEGLEIGPVGRRDARHHQAPRAVLLLDVDRDPEVDRAVIDHVRLAVALLEAARHRPPFLTGLDDRPGDQVGERNLQAALGEGAVEGLPLGVESVDGERPERGRGRDRAALLHRLGEHPGRTAQDLRFARGLRRSGSVAAFLGGDDVGLHDPPAGAGAGNAGEVDSLGGGDPPGDGGGLGVARGGAVAGRRRWCRSGLGSRRCGASAARSRLEAGERLADLDDVVGLDERLEDGAGDGGGDLGVDLVGRDLDDRVALGDLVARLLVPLEDDALGDRLAHLGHHEVERLAGRSVGGVAFATRGVFTLLTLVLVLGLKLLG